MDKKIRLDDVKAKALAADGALNPHPERIKDEAFLTQEFFDPRDRVQTKYEMVRRRQIDGKPVTDVAVSFGVSRQAFYTTETAFNAKGLPGLIPRRRGPRRAHKLTDEILDFVKEWRAAKDPKSQETEVQAIKRRFGIGLHPRSIERALARRKKKLQNKGNQRP